MATRNKRKRRTTAANHIPFTDTVTGRVVAEIAAAADAEARPLTYAEYRRVAHLIGAGSEYGETITLAAEQGGLSGASLTVSEALPHQPMLTLRLGVGFVDVGTDDKGNVSMLIRSAYALRELARTCLAIAKEADRVHAFDALVEHRAYMVTHPAEPAAV